MGDLGSRVVEDLIFLLGAAAMEEEDSPLVLSFRFPMLAVVINFWSSNV